MIITYNLIGDNMNYIKRSIEGIIVSEEESINVNKGLVSYVNKMCLSNGSSLQGRIDYSRQILGTKNKVPFLVSDDILLIPTHSFRSYECVLVNLFEVVEIKENNSVLKLSFKDGTLLDIGISMYIWRNQCKKANVLVSKHVKRKCLHDGLIDRFYYENLV